MSALWEREDFRRVAQGAWRPGGTALTRRGLALCRLHSGLTPGALVLDLGCGDGATPVSYTHLTLPTNSRV